MSDFVYISELDDSQVQKKFDEIEKRASDLASKLSKEFSTIQSAGTSSFDNIKKTAINAISAINSSLKQTKSLVGSVGKINLGQQKRGGVPVVIEPEIRDTNVINIFANELKKRTSDALSQSLIDEAQKFAPDLDAFEEVIRQTDRLDSEQIELSKTLAVTRNNLQSLIGTLDNVADQDGAVDTIKQLQERLEAIDLKETADLNQIKTLMDDVKEASKLQLAFAKNTKKAQDSARRDFVKTLRTFPQLKGELVKLSDEYGDFNLVLTKNESELTEVQRKALALVNANRVLAKSVDKITDEFGELNVEVGRSKLGNIPKQTKAADSGFGKLGITAGATAAVVSKLLQLFGRFFDSVARGFAGLVKDSVEVAQQFEVLETTFINLADGSEQGGRAILNFVNDLSARVGADVAGLAQAFLPFVSSFEQLEDLAKRSVELSALSVATGKPASASEINRALAEAISGDLRSLRSIFELLFEETDIIDDLLDAAKQAGEDGGDALNQGLQEILGEGRGIVFEEIISTATGQMDVLKQQFRVLKNELGEPLNIALKEALGELTTFIADNKDEIGDLLSIIAEIIINLSKPITEGLTENLNGVNFEEVNQSLRNVNETVIRTKPALESLGKIIKFIGDSIDPLDLEKPFEPISLIAKYLLLTNPLMKGFLTIINLITTTFFDFNVFDAMSEGVDNLNNKFNSIGQTAQQLSVVVLEAFIELINMLGGPLISTINAVIAGLNSLGADIDLVPLQEQLALVTKIEDVQRGIIGNINEQNDAVAESNKRLDESAEKRRNDETPPDIFTDQDGNVEVGLTDKEVSAQEDIIKKRLEIEKSFIEKQLDSQIDASRQRQKIEQDLVDKLISINLKHRQALDDQLIKHSDNIQDIDIKDALKRDDIAQKSAEKRLDTEKDFERRLRDLRRRFSFDALEAIRQNDAVTFLQLKRKLAFDERVARTKRDDELDDVKDNEDKKLKEQDKARDRDIEKAILANHRKTRDLEISLLRNLELAQEAHRQSLRDQQLSEQQKQEDLQNSYERQLADFETFKAEKEGTFSELVASELAIIEAGNAQILDMESEFYQTRLRNLNDFMSSRLQGLSLGITPDGNLVGTEGTGFEEGELSPESDEKYLVRLRKQATALIIGSGRPDEKDLLASLSGLTVSDISSLIKEFGLSPVARRKDKTVGRKFGGSMLPGITYLVGEEGPELLQTQFPASIKPLADPNNFSLPLSTVSRDNINNSKSISTNLSMLDPSALSPAQLAIVQNIVNQSMMALMSGI